jgi:hypothetical protein
MVKNNKIKHKRGRGEVIVQCYFMEELPHAGPRRPRRIIMWTEGQDKI